MEKIRECLFCGNEGPYNTIEHIVPESLGNDEDYLTKMVCDNCQNYLGREVEKLALEKTPIAIWRVLLGLKNKKGSLPSIDLITQEKGRLPASHELTDRIGFTAHKDWSTSVDIFDPLIIQSIKNKEKNSFNLILTPWHLSIMGRFLGKMGLEYIAMNNFDLAQSASFDEMRNFVRDGFVNKIWPIYWGKSGDLKKLKSPINKVENFLEQEIHCYSYSIGISKKDEYIFAFLMGTDLMLINLTNRQLNAELLDCVEGVDLTCVWYPDGSWEKN
ncbi:MAG: HNH endonuclease [Chloroflexota bacterium]|nr:HNH endonuclease [Chloroflexota bacterium]